MKIKLKQNWYLYFIFGLAVLQVLVFTLWGEHSFIAIHDNLDLFVAHNKIMKNQEIFFGSGQDALLLGGVSRDLLGSEFSLYNILYFIFPPYVAYVCGYFLKIIIGFVSFLLLLKEIYKEKFSKYKSLAYLVAAAFALIPVFPAYAIAFVSVPLVVYLLIKIYKCSGWYWYGLLFLYPLISYFSYFGIFLLGYMVLAFFYLWFKEKKIPFRFGLAIPVLALGYMTWEYRLFGEMLLSDTVSIRDSMVQMDVGLGQMFRDILAVMVNPGFHAQSSHQYWIFPVAVYMLLWEHIGLLKERNYRGIRKHPINLTFLFIVFNCVVYGLYELKVVQQLVETILPPLKGFQFNRTIFFNPFLWYLLFFFILKELYDRFQYHKIKNLVLHGIAVGGLLVCMFAPQVYNDFYHNCYHHAYEILKGTPSTQLSFQQFYSEELFESIKEDLEYDGEWAAAYGMHPAVLQYNGIATLDGYLGLYSEEYKQQFGKLIAPALERSEEFHTTFWESGIRAYLYSGAGENTYQPLKELNLTDNRLYIDPEVFREMNGTYIFSRIAISNAKELGLTLRGEYTHESSPYIIYVYENI